jgi:two-component system chemotaxis response regulator CheY
MKQILVVDASRATRAALRAIIEPLGLQVDEAGDGPSALARIASGTAPVAVLYSDEQPGMNAPAFISALRRTPGVVHPPVIVIGDDRTLDHIRDVLRYGATEYLMPPFDEEILEGKLVACGAI